MTQPPLTIPDAINLNTVLEAAQQSARVVWFHDDQPFYGTARHIVKSPENYGFLSRDEDVRDGHLRITAQSGFDLTLPVSELMEQAARGEFLIYDWAA